VILAGIYIHDLKITCSAFQHLLKHIFDAHSHSYGHFHSAMCGVSGLLENRVIEEVEVLAPLRTAIRLELSLLIIKLG
jgi:hypothetical protein